MDTKEKNRYASSKYQLSCKSVLAHVLQLLIPGFNGDNQFELAFSNTKNKDPHPLLAAICKR